MADHQYISVNKWLGITDCQIFKLIFLLQDERLNCPVTTCWYGLWTSVVHRSVRRYSPKSIFCSLNADVLGARAWNVPCGLLLLIGAHCWDFVWQMFKNATDDARHLHYALSCTKDPQLLKRCVCVCVCVFCSATKSKQTKGGRSGKFVYDNVGNITNAKG